jgi:hypothetical protein
MTEKIFEILVYVTLGILILTCIPNIIYYSAVAYGPTNKLVDQKFAIVMLWVNVAILGFSLLTLIIIVVLHFMESRKSKKSEKDLQQNEYLMENFL